jgi:hypothetical protein
MLRWTGPAEAVGQEPRELSYSFFRTKILHNHVILTYKFKQNWFVPSQPGVPSLRGRAPE